MPVKAPVAALLAILPAAAHTADLPRVAPPGPGMSSRAPQSGFGDVEEKYDRRLDRKGTGETPGRRAPAPSVLYPTPGGAVTDTGVPLSGGAGVLRDSGGGVWNCTTAGCFSPGGTFLPMKKTAPAE